MGPRIHLVILAGAIGSCVTNLEDCTFQLIVTIAAFLERFERFSVKSLRILKLHHIINTTEQRFGNNLEELIKSVNMPLSATLQNNCILSKECIAVFCSYQRSKEKMQFYKVPEKNVTFILLCALNNLLQTEFQKLHNPKHLTFCTLYYKTMLDFTELILWLHSTSTFLFIGFFLR